MDHANPRFPPQAELPVPSGTRPAGLGEGYRLPDHSRCLVHGPQEPGCNSRRNGCVGQNHRGTEHCRNESHFQGRGKGCRGLSLTPQRAPGLVHGV